MARGTENQWRAVNVLPVKEEHARGEAASHCIDRHDMLLESILIVLMAQIMDAGQRDGMEEGSETHR